MNVLIVDDDPMVLESCRRILESEQYRVQLATGADQAMEIILAAKDLCLVITDIKMPGKDGFYLSRKIHENRPVLPILIMTGYLIEEVRQRIVPGQQIRFLAKPFTPDELIHSVEKILKFTQDNPVPSFGTDITGGH